MKKSDSITLVGSNEDFKKRNSQIWFIPAKKNIYGHAILGYDNSIQAGINEKGLFWDGLRAYPKTKMTNDSNKYDIGGNVLYKISEECSTVDDAINLFKNYFWKGFEVAQIMVVDKSGKSAIITVNNNRLVITNNIYNYQICTNFRITGHEKSENFHWYNIGSKRYKKVKNKIKKLPTNAESFFNVLENTKQNNIFSKTIYSFVTNLNSGDIFICVNGDFNKIKKINLHNELYKGKHSYFLSELVNEKKNNLQNIEIHDDQFISTKNQRIFFNKKWEETNTPKKAKYYRIIEKDTSSENYIMKDYFMNGNLQGKAYYSSLSPKIIHGDYFEYYKNGNIKVKGSFNNRLKNKIWKFFNKDGTVIKTINYDEKINK